MCMIASVNVNEGVYMLSGKAMLEEIMSDAISHHDNKIIKEFNSNQVLTMPPHSPDHSLSSAGNPIHHMCTVSSLHSPIRIFLIESVVNLHQDDEEILQGRRAIAKKTFQVLSQRLKAREQFTHGASSCDLDYTVKKNASLEF